MTLNASSERHNIIPKSTCPERLRQRYGFRAPWKGCHSSRCPLMASNLWPPDSGFLLQDLAARLTQPSLTIAVVECFNIACTCPSLPTVETLQGYMNYGTYERLQELNDDWVVSMQALRIARACWRSRLMPAWPLEDMVPDNINGSVYLMGAISLHHRLSLLHQCYRAALGKISADLACM